MSGANNISPKLSNKRNRSTFPDDLEIPESALHDHKFTSSYVYIFNDPRVYKRQRLNGDRTSSRFEVDYNYQINVVFNEPVVKRKSILTNTQSPKEKNLDDSGKRKSVSFLSKITFIDAVELDGGSSEWSDADVDEYDEKSKIKSKVSKDKKMANNMKTGASNGIPSKKNHKKKTKDKSLSKNGHKSKSAPKELFKFKITKPFRKFGRSKEKRLKHLQKKFGRRFFKAFVHVKRSFNLKNIPDKVSVPLEKITLTQSDVSTPEKSITSIQDFLIGQMTKKVKVHLTPMLENVDATNEVKINDTEIIQSNLIESNTSSEISISSSSISSENNLQSDCQIDSNERQNNGEAAATESIKSDQSKNMNGDLVPVLSNDDPDMTTISCNDTKPSPELVTSNPLPNKFEKITCNMYYNTNKDETATMNGQMLESNDHNTELVENISSMNLVSFSMQHDSLTENILRCDASEIANIQLNLLND